MKPPAKPFPFKKPTFSAPERWDNLLRPGTPEKKKKTSAGTHNNPGANGCNRLYLFTTDPPQLFNIMMIVFNENPCQKSKHGGVERCMDHPVSYPPKIDLFCFWWVDLEPRDTWQLALFTVVPNLIFNVHNNSLETEGPKKPTKMVNPFAMWIPEMVLDFQGCWHVPKHFHLSLQCLQIQCRNHKYKT